MSDGSQDLLEGLQQWFGHLGLQQLPRANHNEEARGLDVGLPDF